MVKKFLGVKEFFEKLLELRKWRIRYDIYKRIDVSYYGYRDDEDGVFVKLEGFVEKKMRVEVLAEWNLMEEIKREVKKVVKSGEVAIVMIDVKGILFEEEEEVVEEERRMEEERLEEEEMKRNEFVVYVSLFDEKEIERMVVEKKKMELLSKYFSENLVEE